MERSNGCQKRRVEHIVRGASAPLLVAGSAPLASRDAGEHAADKYKAGQGRMTQHLRENGDCSTHEHIERARSARMTLQKRGLGGLTWRQEAVDDEEEAPPNAVVEGSSAVRLSPHHGGPPKQCWLPKPPRIAEEPGRVHASGGRGQTRERIRTTHTLREVSSRATPAFPLHSFAGLHRLRAG